MNFLRLFDRFAGGQRNKVLAIAAAGGFLSALVVLVVNEVATDSLPFPVGLAVLLKVMLIAMHLCNRAATRAIVRIFEDAQQHLRDSLAAAIRHAPVRAVEEMDAVRGRALGDLTVLATAIDGLVSSIQYTAFTVFITVCICLLSFKGAFMWLAIMGGLMILIGPRLTRLRTQYRSVSMSSGQLHQSVEELLAGFKQIKLDVELREHVLGDIRTASAARSERMSEVSTIGQKIFIDAFMLFFAGGFCVLFMPTSTIGIEGHVKYDMLSYMILAFGPMLALLQIVPMMTRAEGAASSLFQLIEQLRDAGDDGDVGDSGGIGRESSTPPVVKRIEMRGLRFSYPATDDGEPGFSVGPIDMTLEPGTLTLVTGDNGSGKTTLMNMLLGLYHADAGAILWDEHVVDKRHLGRYRNLFSVIYNNQYLFDRLYGVGGSQTPRTEQTGASATASEPAPDSVARVHALLRRLGIEEVTDLDGDRWTNIDLSSGQRMRLAMVVALLEDRPVYVFDEWTANQDPETTWLYYDTLVPELLAAGKIVVAVSHDDRFFDRADRLVRMHAGQVVDGG